MKKKSIPKFVFNILKVLKYSVEYIIKEKEVKL